MSGPMKATLLTIEAAEAACKISEWDLAASLISSNGVRQPLPLQLPDTSARTVSSPSVDCGSGSAAVATSAAAESVHDATKELGPVWAVAKNKYEGGMVSWECSMDAAHVLMEAASRSTTPAAAAMPGTMAMSALGSAVRSPVLRLLELGAGTAIPSASVVTLRNAVLPRSGTHTVAVAQDLNREALVHRTGPSLALAAGASSSSPSAAIELVAGPWGPEMDSSLLRACGLLTDAPASPAGAFLVIASETVYRSDILEAHASSLVGLLAAAWQAGCRPCCGLVAAKRFYFGQGLGGGSTAFTQAVTRRAASATTAGAKLNITRVAHVDDGASNVRDVVVLWLCE